MNVRLEVTWEDGTVKIYGDIPVKEYERLGEDAVKTILEQKFKKKIKSMRRLDKVTPPAQGGRQQGGQDDRNKSSERLPVNPDSAPQANTTTAHSRSEEPDYRDKFPDKYTPKNMRRNKWGELIYE